jgi:thiol-disulfide isomerase/thioredoxin
MVAMIFCFATLPLVGFATPPVSVNVKFPSAQKEILYSNTEVFSFLGQAPKKDQTDESGQITLTFQIDQPNLLIIGTREANCRLYLIPGETYSIEFRPSALTSKITFAGNNADGQQMVNDSPGKTFGLGPAKQWNLNQSDNLLKNLEDRIDASLSPYSALLIEGKINKAFYSIVKLEESYYQAYTLSEALLRDYQSGKATGDSSTRRANNRTLEKLFHKYPVHSKELTYASAYPEYIGNYVIFSTTNNPEYDQALARNEGNSYVLAFLKRKLHPDSYKYYAFSFLEGKAASLEKEVVALYENLKKEYPEMAANNQRLSAKVAEVKASYADEGAIALPPGVYVMEDHQEINTLDQLIGKFKGRALYVDLWATWCGPCKGDFELQQPLKEFLKENDIDHVYVAIESGNNVEKWQAFLKKYDLRGYHAIANGQFQQDLKTHSALGYNGRGISVPKYLIINKDGQIVEGNAKRPSDGDALIQQIKEKLNL